MVAEVGGLLEGDDEGNEPKENVGANQDESPPVLTALSDGPTEGAGPRVRTASSE